MMTIQPYQLVIIRSFLSLLVVNFMLLFGATAMAQDRAADIQALVEAQSGKAFGIFGPFPLVASDISVSSKGENFEVLIKDLRYGSIDLGGMKLTLSPLETALYQVDSVSFSGRDTFTFDAWHWKGEWDVNANTYRKLEYLAKGLEMTGASDGLSLGLFDMSVQASDDDYLWNMMARDVILSDGQKNDWRIHADAINYSLTATGSDTLDEYGANSDLLAGTGILQDAAKSAINAEGSIIRQLPKLFLAGEDLMAEQLSPVTNAESNVKLSGLKVEVPALEAVLSADVVELLSSTEPNVDDGTLNTETSLSVDALSLAYGKKTAVARSGRVDMVLNDYALERFHRAVKSLFGKRKPGDSWSFLSDMVAFYQNFSISASLVDARLNLPKHQTAIVLETGFGAFALDDMQKDGASISLIGDWKGFDIVSTTQKTSAEFLKTLVLRGRIFRLDPLTRALLPRNGRVLFELGELPLQQVWVNLASQPQVAPFHDVEAMAKEAITTGMVLMTPFLINPPVAKIMDAEISGMDYKVTLNAEQIINFVLTPFFGYGTATFQVQGATRLEQIATNILQKELAKEEGADKNLVDWAARFKDTWLGPLKRYAEFDGEDTMTYNIEMTQLREVIVNGEVVFGQQ